MTDFNVNIAIEKERNILDDLNNILNTIGEFTETNITKPAALFTEDFITGPILNVTNGFNIQNNVDKNKTDWIWAKIIYKKIYYLINNIIKNIIMTIRNEIDINLYTIIKKVMNKYVINKKYIKDDDCMVWKNIYIINKCKKI